MKHTIVIPLLTSTLCFMITIHTPRLYADIYLYHAEDGSTLMTSTKRSDLKLIRVIESSKKGSEGVSSKKEGGRKRSAAREQKFQAYREEAGQALAESTANHDVPESIEARASYFDDIISEAAQEYNLPFAFIKAVIRIESGFRPDVISHAGAMGLMQLMPRTAELMNVRDPFDPRENIFGGTKYLRILCNRYEGNINLILAAYNAGDGAVARYNGIPYPQTREYVQKIDNWYRIYSSREKSQDFENTPK